MSMDVEEPGKLDIGRVITQTVQVIGRNIVTFSVLALVLVGLPSAIIGWVQMGMMRETLTGISQGNFSFGPGYFEGVGIGGLAAVVTGAILQGTLIYATVQDLSGGRASIGDSLGVGLRNFLPLIGLSILLGLAIVFGIALIVVPGIMMLCAWCVAVPSLVADRTGVFGAFSRSADLTRGNRWRIFALGVLIVVILWILNLIVNAIAGVNTMAGPAGMANMVDRMSSPLFLILSLIRAVISSVIGSTLAAVLYVELRNARELGGPEWLADIFR